MISELFLVCALSAPITFVRPAYNSSDAEVLHYMATRIRAKKPLPVQSFQNWGENNLIGFMHFLGDYISGYRILIVDSEPWLAELFRVNGANAIGVQTLEGYKIDSAFHVIGRAGFLPIREATQHITIWFRHGAEYQPTARRWLTDVTGTIMLGGIFGFPPSMNPHWHVLLNRRGWTQLPFKVFGLEFWKNTSDKFRRKAPTIIPILQPRSEFGGELARSA